MIAPHEPQGLFGLVDRRTQADKERSRSPCAKSMRPTLGILDFMPGQPSSLDFRSLSAADIRHGILQLKAQYLIDRRKFLTEVQNQIFCGMFHP
jgi:hypothetical protein